MVEHQLEKVIVDFIEQKFNVLVCTSIIESGIDMPNVNTLIVDRADRFGLAQLYQLRGRVGRSSVQAFAYFLTPGAHDELSDDARKRLDVIATYQDLGAGFQIASHDLEIRGAGNLLGAEQSGHVSDVGLEMYTDMLDEAIHTIRGEKPKDKIDPEIRIPVTAIIPIGYVPAENLRLNLYKGIFGCESFDELDNLRQDTVDRYGALPHELTRLFRIANIKIDLKSLGATLCILSETRNTLEVKITNANEDLGRKLIKTAMTNPSRYRVLPDNRFVINFDKSYGTSEAEQDALLEHIQNSLTPLAFES